MPKYFFHLAGQLPAHDLLGHDCANDREAKDHGSFIAHRIGTEKPGMIREGNFISVTDELGKEIFQAPLASVMWFDGQGFSCPHRPRHRRAYRLSGVGNFSVMRAPPLNTYRALWRQCGRSNET